MSKRIVWKDVDVRLYGDGEEAGQYFCTTFTIDELIDVDKARPQGASVPDIDGDYNGVRGTFEFLIVDGFADPREVFEGQVEKIKSREPGGEIRAVVSRRKPGTQQREAFRIGPMIVQPSDRASDTQRWTETWSYDASELKRIAG